MPNRFNFKFLFITSFLIVLTGLTLIISQLFFIRKSLISPVVNETKKILTSLSKYSINNLKSQEAEAGNLVVAANITDTPEFSSNIFVLSFKDASVSGLINIPKNKKPVGTIILLRGFVDREIYESGMGTRRIGE